MTPILLLFGTFLFSAAALVICVLAFKALRRRDARRSPLSGRKLPHLPGQQLLARVAEHEEEVLLSAIVMYVALPFMLLAWALQHVPWQSVQWRPADTMFIVAAVGAFALGLWRFQHHYKERAKAQDGLIAERMTGQQLNRLAGPDCIVMHDLPCGSFNIDHVVIAPRAVYAIETKSFRKPRGSTDDSHYRVGRDGDRLLFPGWHDTAAIGQARRQGQWLSQYLNEALGEKVPVISALALPGWWIDPADGPAPDVKLFTPMGRGAEFMRAASDVLPPSRRSLVAQALALRYPNIEE